MNNCYTCGKPAVQKILGRDLCEECVSLLHETTPKVKEYFSIDCFDDTDLIRSVEP